jgi:hypothetical protein
MVAGLESLVGARMKREVHDVLVTVKSKVEEMRTFHLLARKQLNKRAHPTQWHIHGGVLSDLMTGFAQTLGTVYSEMRFALKLNKKKLVLVF